MSVDYPIIYISIILLLVVITVVLIAVSQRRKTEFNLQQLELVKLQAEKQQLENQQTQQQEQLQQINAVNDELTQQLNEQKIAFASLQATSEEERKSAAEKLKLLEQAKNDLTKEFENLANRIFEEKSEKFTQLNKTSVDATVNPLREQLKEFKQRVEFVYDKESKDRQSLLAEIGHLKNLNNQISQDAVNLTKALKGESKTQGNWGEIILEKVLEESGLRKGHEYETQVSLKDEAGKRKAPDVIVRLPDDKDIVVDAKVSLVDYERYCSADEEVDKLQALKAHVASIKTHVKGLSVKNYDGLEGLRSLDFVLMFIPIEAAFLTAFEQDPELFRDAYERNIIVVSPTTLLATLRTIQSIWRYERQNKNAEEIAAQAGKLYDQIASVAESLLEVGKHIDKAAEAQQTAVKRLSTGRGNLVGRAEKLENLGAKIKRNIPAALKDSGDSTNSDTEE